MKKRMGPGIVDNILETLAFGVCNTDGLEGLSWAEVEQCTVSYNITFTGIKNISASVGI